MLPIRPFCMTVLCALAVCAGGAFAQSAAPARADVKAEARAAVRAGTTAEGELKDSAASAPGVSQKSRRQVKDEAKAAVRRGDAAEGEARYRGPERIASGASG